MSDIEDRMKELERRLEERQQALQKKYEDRLGGVMDRLSKEPRSAGGTGRSHREILPAAVRGSQAFSARDLVGRELTPRAAAAAGGEAADRRREQARAQIEAFPGEVLGVAGLALHCRFVSQNPAYLERAAKVSVVLLSDDTVNAFATDGALPYPEAAQTKPPLIAVFHGLCHASRLTASGLAGHAVDGQPIVSPRVVPVLRSIGELIVRGRGRLELDAAVSAYVALGLADQYNEQVARRMHSIASGTLLAVIAHELGHICLNHTLGSSVELSISRNQEREADSFASSVMAVTPFADYSVLGGVLFWMLLTWLETAAGDPAETTHPPSLERLFDFIRANKSQAGELGLTAETVSKCLPKQLEAASREFLA